MVANFIPFKKGYQALASIFILRGVVAWKIIFFQIVHKILQIKHEKMEPVNEVGKGQIALRNVIRVGALAYIAKALAEDIKNLSDAGNKGVMNILNKWLKKRYEVTTGALGTDNAQLILNKYTSLFNAVSEQYEKTTKTQNMIMVFV